VIAAQVRRCEVCQLWKPNGIASDDGQVFICDQCDADAAALLEIQDSLYISPDAPDGD
jgi:hypothetical protein